jgi:hypothetical protein
MDSEHEELLGFIKKSEKNNILDEELDTIVGRYTVINDEDILNLRIALNSPAPKSVDPLIYFLSKV